MFAASLISNHKRGMPECFLLGHVKTSMDYTLDFVPSLAEGKLYHCKITMEPEGVPCKRANVASVEDV